MDTTPRNNDDIAPLSPEEIKAIGEIQIGPAKHEIFLNKHYKKLIIGGIALMIAASGAICYATYVQERNARAGAALVAATNIKTPGTVTTAADYDATGLASLVGDYADTASAATAELMEGLSLLSGEGDAAQQGISRLEQLAANSGSDIIRARAQAALALYYTRQNDAADKAKAAWQSIIAMPQNPYTALAYLSLGDLAKQAGELEQARTFYTQISTACPSSPIVRQGTAEMRLQLLEVEAPTPVAPTPEPAKPAASPFASPLQGSSPFFPSVSTMPGSGE